MVVTEEMEARGDREVRKEGRRLGGGGGAKAFCPKGLLVPGAGCYFGTVPAHQDQANGQYLPAAPVGTPQVSPSWASPPATGRPLGTLGSSHRPKTPFFAGSGSVIRVWSPGGLHPSPWGCSASWEEGRGPAGLPSSGTHVSWALDSDRSLLASGLWQRPSCYF